MSEKYFLAIGQTVAQIFLVRTTAADNGLSLPTRDVHIFEGKMFKSHFKGLHLDPRDLHCQDMEAPLKTMTLGFRFGLQLP